MIGQPDPCCICLATGEHRAGRYRGGVPLPLCAQHFAASTWRLRQPPPVITWPPSAEQLYFAHAMMQAGALGGF